MERHRRETVRAVEQTVLAYRRTALQIGALALAAARVLSETLGWWVLVAALASIALMVAVQRSVRTFADTIDENGRVDWAPRGVGHGTARHAWVAGGAGLIALLAGAWILMKA
ncbi:hypothetical protein [Demequina silvatica]|uniref:hypothetical protein n=1 Tax=Demequina silvatica TaxID=1638988 RepID=UPI000781BE56|nr:hypothetical protein [Demequina silvatica]